MTSHSRSAVPPPDSLAARAAVHSAAAPFVAAFAADPAAFEGPPPGYSGAVSPVEEHALDSMDRVYNGVYVSSRRGASVLPRLLRRRIAAVINVCCTPAPLALEAGLAAAGITHVHIPVLDAPSENIVEVARAAWAAIGVTPGSGGAPRVLVHCEAGVSRSVSCVLYLMMLEKNIDPRAALAQVRLRRPVACPNPGFMASLERLRAGLWSAPAAWLRPVLGGWALAAPSQRAHAPDLAPFAQRAGWRRVDMGGAAPTHACAGVRGAAAAAKAAGLALVLDPALVALESFLDGALPGGHLALDPSAKRAEFGPGDPGDLAEMLRGLCATLRAVCGSEGPAPGIAGAPAAPTLRLAAALVDLENRCKAELGGSRLAVAVATTADATHSRGATRLALFIVSLARLLQSNVLIDGAGRRSVIHFEEMGSSKIPTSTSPANFQRSCVVLRGTRAEWAPASTFSDAAEKVSNQAIALLRGSDRALAFWDALPERYPFLGATCSIFDEITVAVDGVFCDRHSKSIEPVVSVYVRAQEVSSSSALGGV
jgi:atypical dual specificity phosphatase